MKWLLLVALMASCTHRLGMSARCVTLEDRKTLWGSLAAGAGAATGASGLTTIPIEDKDARIAVTITSVTFGVFSAFASMFASSASEAFGRECGSEK